VTFDGGSTVQQFDKGGRPQPVVFDTGVVPQPEQDLSLMERAEQAISGLFDTQTQRAAMYDPATGQITSPTMEKMSDNMITDTLVNAINPFGAITGIIDTATYQPLTGGESYQYSDTTGGLLSFLDGAPNLTSFSELEARSVADRRDGGDGDAQSRQPLVVPEQTPEEEREQSSFPAFTPRRYEYQPYVGQFYTIPSRFTQPYGLLG